MLYLIANGYTRRVARYIKIPANKNLNYIPSID